MAMAQRVVGYLVMTVVIVAFLVVVAAVGLTHTDFGVERTGQFVIDRLERSVHGTITVGDIGSPSLLGQVTLRDLEIADTGGRPFVRADSARLGYRLATLLRGSVVFDRITLWGADVVIEQLPGDTRWNYERILSDTTSASDTVSTAPDTASGGDETLILIREATVRDSRVTVRMPWEVEEGSDTSRLILETVPGGRVRTLRFDSVNVRLPRVVWESPDTRGKLLEVEDLSARAYVWDTPAEIRELDGTVAIRDSIIDIVADRARLPESELSSIDARVITAATGNLYDLEADGDSVAFRDFQWLYPRLPDDGGGTLRFSMETRRSGRTVWLARDARLSSRGSELAGSFGLVTGDTVYFRDVEIRATPLDLDLAGSLLPDGLPASGLLIGTVAFDGPPSALRTEGDLRYRTFDPEGEGAESSVRWAGLAGVEAPYRVRELELELRSVDLAQVAQFVPAIRVRGQVQGSVRAEGSLESGLRVDGGLTLDHGEGRSVVEGSGQVALAGTPTFDLEFEAQPLALSLVADQLPALEGLRGDARGPVTISGTPNDLTIGLDLATPAGGVVVEGRLSVNGRTRYRAEGSVSDFRLDRVVSRLPETLVTGRFDVQGAGFDPEDIEGDLSLDVLSATVDGVEIYRGALRGSVSDALARVDSLSFSTEVGELSASGSFGFVEERPGELAFEVMADSLVFLEPLFFGDRPPLDVGMEEANRIDGRVTASGRLTGSVPAWRVSGTTRIRSFVFDQLKLGRGSLDVVWQPDSLWADASLEALEYGDRRLSSAEGTVQYAAGRGVVSARVRGRRGQALEIESAFQPQGDVADLNLRRLRLATRDGEWTLRDTAEVTVGGAGFWVDSLTVVREPTDARIRVAGVLPWRQPEADEVQEASLTLDLDRVPVGEILRVTQSDTLVDGLVTGTVEVTGTALRPRLDARLDARSFRYGGAVLDSARSRVSYEDRVIDGTVSGWDDGSAIVTGRIHVPIDLALTPMEHRLLDQPMDVTFEADGMSAGLLAFLTPGFRDLGGRVQGRMAILGTTVDPDLEGQLQLMDGSAYFDPLAVAYRDVQLTARMNEGTAVEVEASLSTRNGRGRIQGTLDLEEPSDPRFDLTVEARRLDATRRRDVTAIVDGLAQLRGRYTRPVVTGDVRIIRGEMNLDEIWRQHQIVQLDTTLFQVMDTTEISYRPTPENPFLRNLRVTNMEVTMRRNFWLRSEELAMEVGGTISVEIDRRADDLRLTGTLNVVEGSYELLAQTPAGGRRFSIRSGTIEFVGTPGIDPNLNIEAVYRVRRPQGEPLNVVARVSGTLQDPRVALTSDAEIPMSETDLASYILFGRAGAELTQSELDAASTGGLLAAGLFRPVVTGGLSTLTQEGLTSLGIPVDYVSLSLPEYGVSEYGSAYDQSGPAGIFQNAQIEVGFDPTSNVSVIGSVRFRGAETESALRLFGARVEYRPWETWTIEGYIEDQFARTPSFGSSEIADRKVLGITLFREWGY
ncbi:MAG: translocation/assembly module TamB domain-containing protein [Candidatus Longimicrobiales bacterium M2_2A_002]